MVRYCELFYTFFKIGGFTIGGGYAMIPLMEQELVDRHAWLSREEFMDQLSVAQSMPGVFAVNMATSVGYRLRGVGGSIVSIAANIMLPVIVILLLALFFRSFRDNLVVVRIFMGIRPAVVALIAAPVFRMARTAGLSLKTIWIPLLAACLICIWGVSPVWVVLASILLGLLVRMVKGDK